MSNSKEDRLLTKWMSLSICGITAGQGCCGSVWFNKVGATIENILSRFSVSFASVTKQFLSKAFVPHIKRQANTNGSFEGT